MKRGTFRHPKTLELAERLGVEPVHALGLVEAMCEWAEQYSPTGALENWRAVVKGVEYTGDAERLLEAMTAEGSRWVDEASDGLPRRIHDWADHCSDGTHRVLARAGKRFADGTIPKLTRLTAEERARAEAVYAPDRRPACAQHAPNVRPTCAQHAPNVRPTCALSGPVRSGPVLSESVSGPAAPRAHVRGPSANPEPEAFRERGSERVSTKGRASTTRARGVAAFPKRAAEPVLEVPDGDELLDERLALYCRGRKVDPDTEVEAFVLRSRRDNPEERDTLRNWRGRFRKWVAKGKRRGYAEPLEPREPTAERNGNASRLPAPVEYGAGSEAAPYTMSAHDRQEAELARRGGKVAKIV